MHRKTAQKIRQHRSPRQFLKAKIYEIEEYEPDGPPPVQEGTELGTAAGQPVVATTTVGTDRDPEHAKHVAVTRQTSKHARHAPSEDMDMTAVPILGAIDAGIVDEMNLQGNNLDGYAETGDVAAATG